MDKIQHVVYWTENSKPCSESFTSIDMMLQFCTMLRKDRCEGRNISFITSIAENPNCTSLQGVDSVSLEKYIWKKRRP